MLVNLLNENIGMHFVKLSNMYKIGVWNSLYRISNDSYIDFISINFISFNINFRGKIIINIAFARGGVHLPIAHALRLLSTKEL